MERNDLVAVLSAIRSNSPISLGDLGLRLGLGRSVIAARVAELLQAGLIVEAGVGPSTGGRAPRQVRLRADAGAVIGVDVEATGLRVGIADLHGTILDSTSDAVDVAAGPDVVLRRVESRVDELLARHEAADTLWGMGVGLPGPVEFATGLPVAPPIMPGWDGYDVRQRLSARYDVPVWVDNDVNLMALGEMRVSPAARAVDDLLYVKIGTGIGAGLVSGGRVHRGHNGCAGDIGHVAVPEASTVICRCGNVGCLEAVAGGAALAREGRRLAETGGSPVMAEMLSAERKFAVSDVSMAAEQGDPAACALLSRAGRLVGTTLATLVSFYNPALVILGGGVVNAGDPVLAAIREAVYRRSLPLATRTLRIEPSRLTGTAALAGAVHLVLDELHEPVRAAHWLPSGSPAGMVDLPVIPSAAA